MDVEREVLLHRYAAAALEGDNVALGELVRLTQPAVWRLCAALGSPGEEDDLVQETYLRAIRALSGYRADAPVQVWLLTIARRVCADHVRRRQRQRRLIDRISRQPQRLTSAPPEMVDDLLEGLDPERREAFVLTQMLGLSYEEAAGVMECPVGTVRSRVSRARADLVDATHRAEAN